MNQKKKILIADDNLLNREILGSIFADNYEVLQADDGKKTIDIIQSENLGLSLVFLDLMMPKMDGFEVLKHLKRIGLIKQIPIVIVTGSSQLEDEIKAYNLGAVEVIRKPFTPQAVLRRAENLIELFESRKIAWTQLEMRTKELKETNDAYVMAQSLLEERTAELAESRMNDTLTGLYNKNYFLELAEEKIVNRGDKNYSVIFFNIRDFKYFNFKYGLSDGNKVLYELGDKLREVYETELYARFGNDHFVVLTDEENPRENIDRVFRFFGTKFGHVGIKLKTGIYHIGKEMIGAAEATDFAKVACDSIRNATEYVCEYDERLEHNVQMQTFVMQSIDEAIEKKHIQVYYQPVVHTLTGDICGFEALARWIDPEKGFLSPGDFIPALEEKRQITKLDLYMVREVCKNLKESENRGIDLIPVSINLSRLDFIGVDIVSEIENILMEYGVARDFINLEITESTLMDDPESIRSKIGQFRETGYQVWMDDFGSGYSSLNVLKDFEFDELKLDMNFLTTFDERSKRIVKSIVSMAKDIGIKTLAEGVETKEQLEFLREIGCEKAQGYYLGRPASFEDSLKNMNHFHIETRAWREYYDKVSAVNFLTEKTLSIVEYDGKDFYYAYVNEAFRDVWRSLGAFTMDTVYTNVNATTSPLSKQFREYREELHPGEEAKDLIYSVRGQYVRLHASCIVEKYEKAAYVVEITNLSNGESDEEREKLDYTFRTMYVLYDSIYSIDLREGIVKPIMHGSYKPKASGEVFHSSEKDPLGIATSFIHPLDRDQYHSFTELSTLEKRLKEAKNGYVKGYFRTKSKNGAYVWKEHIMLYLPESERIIYSTMPAPLDDKGLIDRIAGTYQNAFEEQNHPKSYEWLMHGLTESRTMNMFWKDRNRRFLGANQKFLDVYGFDSIDDIYGKTDEDMGWHINDEPFKTAEKNIIERGDVVLNQLGQCIIKGVSHNIMASKEPLYENGQIAGLIGFFIDLDSLDEKTAEGETVALTDKMTGLMSAQGIAVTVSEYLERWSAGGEDFAIIQIRFGEYSRAVKTYGEATAKEMLRAIGHILSETVSFRGTSARLYAGNFIVVMKCKEHEEVEQLIETICERTKKVTTLAGKPATLHPVIHTFYASKVKNPNTLIGIALSGAIIDMPGAK